MDNSEIDLFQMMKTIWEKRKQILFYTIIIVFSAVAFAYVQPKAYETHTSAFVFPSKGNTSAFQYALPEGYYEKFSKSPKILKAVLENLPNEAKTKEKALSLGDLRSALRVESTMLNASSGLTSAALKFNFYVRHTDPFSAHQIAITWKNVIENNIAAFEKSVILSKYSQVEEQFKMSKENWEQAKNKLLALSKSFNVQNKSLELQSFRRSISRARVKSEVSSPVHKLKLKEDYLLAKETLDEYMRLLALEPKVINLSMDAAGKFEKNMLRINPIYTELRERVLASKVALNAIKSQQALLERTIRDSESDIKTPSKNADSLKLTQNESQLKIITKQIQEYEKKSRDLDNKIIEMKIAIRNLNKEEAALANLHQISFKKFEELRLLRSQNESRLNFLSSELEPPVFLGSSMQRTVFIAFGTGLIFMILVTLIKANFSAQDKNGVASEQVNTQYAKASLAGKASGEMKAVTGEKVTPPAHVSEPLNEPKPQYSPALMDVGFVEDR
ncbi:MAG: hypothetical protein HN472_04100 [Nitrospina sp.]|jgi:capsular polysaccharide biosynthesis protein|nr:hypothetical protein [Nitrospina sp.]MBT3875006.1 hypothetical protein [Nitrospina sp.]MBT4049657.1 hypothetical protein [Nitrospina sp.]MBT4556346.1 hypothetical protein [Nitrospina sp.]MBT5348171.1 hypothetical protein [Nitrospina sp.]